MHKGKQKLLNTDISCLEGNQTLKMISIKMLITLLFTLVGLSNGFSLPERSFENFKESGSQCPVAPPVETGKIKDPEIVEASGMVASVHNPGVYYVIQDSQNPNKVYSFLYDGEAIGNTATVE